MMCLNTLFPVILYLLGIILLIALIVLCIKLFVTLKKVDQVIDDISEKSSKLDNLFSIVDRSTDAISIITDKAVDFIVGTLVGFFSRKKNVKEEEENE